MRSVVRLSRVIALAIALAGCGGPFADALDRGDTLARAGNWDAAAAAYEEAVRLDPGDTEARQRLERARAYQVEARIEAGRRHLERGEHAAALAVTQEAVRLSPASSRARAALDAVNAAALGRVRQLLDGGQAGEALDLVLRVRAGAPQDPTARALESEARSRLADAAIERADAHLAAGRLGNALLELAAASRVAPGYRDAAARAGALRARLESELRFFAVLERGQHESEARVVAQLVEQELLSEHRSGARPLLVFGETVPAPGAAGIRFRLRLEGYDSGRNAHPIQRGCTWVCGVDRLPNPAHEAAERAVSAAERRLAAAQDEAARARDRSDRRAREASATHSRSESAARAFERAQKELESCRTRIAPSAAPSPDGADSKPAPRRRGDRCRDEEAAVKDAAAASELAARRAEQAETARRQADERLAEAQREHQDAGAALQGALAELRNTPAYREVERSCDHQYVVTVHQARAAVSLIMRAAVLGEGPPRDLPPVPYEVRRSDETFAAEPGRCAILAGGDPLDLPDAEGMRRALSATVAEGVRGSIQGSYDEYRKAYQLEEQQHRTAGRELEAREARVRWLLLGGGGAELDVG